MEEKTTYMMLCPACGRLRGMLEDDPSFNFCIACHTMLINLGTRDALNNEMQQKKAEHLISEDIALTDYIRLQYKPQYYIGGKEEELRNYNQREIQQEEEARTKREEEQKIKNHQPKCPTCSSYNVQRIGVIERGTSIAFLGLFSGKLGKTMKCNDCGYMW